MTETRFDPATDGRVAGSTGRFRDLRLRAGMTMEEAGRLFGVGPATIYKWERGTRTPSPRYARAIAEVIPDLEALAAKVGRGTR